MLFDLDLGVLTAAFYLLPIFELTTPPMMLCELKFSELASGLTSYLE